MAVELRVNVMTALIRQLDDEGGGGDDSDNSDVYTWNVDFKLNINWIYSSEKNFDPSIIYKHDYKI